MAAKLSLICCILADEPSDTHPDAALSLPACSASKRAVERRQSKIAIEGPQNSRRFSLRPRATAQTDDLGSKSPELILHSSNLLESKSSKVTAFLRRKLSRTRSISKQELRDNAAETQEAKRNLRNSLMSEVHGYDPDARILEDPEVDVPDTHDEFGMRRSRSENRISWREKRRSTLPSRQSVSYTEPQTIRHSRSLGSLVSIPRIGAFSDIRLPSFSAALTSRTWRQSLIEELHIGTPVPLPQPSPPFKDNTKLPIESPSLLRSSMVLSTRRERLTPRSKFTAAVGALHHQSDGPCVVGEAITTDTVYHARAGRDHPQEQQADEDTKKDDKHVEVLPDSAHEEPDVLDAQLSTSGTQTVNNEEPIAPVVHLQDMRISQHLRIDSSATTRANTRVNTRFNSSTSLSPDSFLPSVSNNREDKSPSRPFLTEGEGTSDDTDAFIANESVQIRKDLTGANALRESASDIAELAKVCAARADHDIPPNRLDAIYPLLDQSKGEHDSVIDLPFLPFPPASTALLQFVVEDEINSYAGLQEQPLISDNRSTSTLGKESRFKEEIDIQIAKAAGKRRSLLGLFRFSRKDDKSQDDDTTDRGLALDGPSEGPQQLKRAAPLDGASGATGLMAAAVKKNASEKSALFLSPNKDQLEQPKLRERSASVARPASAPGTRPSVSRQTLTMPKSLAHPRSNSPFLTPNFANVDFSGALMGEGSSNRRESLVIGPLIVGPYCQMLGQERRQSQTPMLQVNDQPIEIGVDTSPLSEEQLVDLYELTDTDLGSWARYPSHCRHARSGSAGKWDGIIVRDFAPEIHRQSTTASTDMGSDINRSARQKVKSARGRSQRTGVQKSRSMVFAKDVIKNYAKHILAPNTDFLKHGHGHRTSISTGGDLAHPELEVLPPIFSNVPVVEEEDAGLEPIELVSMANSDVEDPANRHRLLSTAVPRFDGTSEPTDAQAFSGIVRQMSEPVIGALEREEIVPGNKTKSGPFSSHPYASCVLIPRTSVDKPNSDVPISNLPGLKHGGNISTSLQNSSVDLLTMVQEMSDREDQKLQIALENMDSPKHMGRDFSNISLLVGPPSLTLTAL